MPTQEQKASNLLTSLRVNTNGAAFEAMQSRGLIYKVNYGVALPSIRVTAKEYFPDTQLFKDIYLSDTRELILASLYIANPEEISLSDAEFLSRGVITTEVADVLAMKLLSSSADAWDFTFEWLDSDNPLLCYASLMCGLRVMDTSSLEFLAALPSIKHKQAYIEQALEKIEQKFDMMLQFAEE